METFIKGVGGKVVAGAVVVASKAVVASGALLTGGSSLAVGFILGGVTAIVIKGKKRSDQIKKNQNLTKQQKKKEIQKLNQQICQQFFQFSQTINIQDKKDKNYICFIGPTSVGKSTLINDLFKLKLATGLGKTTTQIQKIYQTNNQVYFDAPGKDNDWQVYQDKDVNFFKSIDRCFLIYQGQPKEVKFIGQLLSKMGKQLILVRNKCDNHFQNMKPIDEVLEQDRNELKQMKIQFKQVIASSFKDRKQIKKFI